MPELPEVERVRMCLDSLLPGRRVIGLHRYRPGVTHAVRTPASRGTGRAGPPATRAELLLGARIVRLERVGKELAIHANDGRTICCHLGMSGQLLSLQPHARMSRTDHVHISWRFDDGSRLVFRDPRRFGGIWAFPTPACLLNTRWSHLGPDAASIRADVLDRRLSHTRRAIKAGLLDQRIVAGIGNIYADESLFVAGLHPLTPANRLGDARTRLLATAIRTVLREAIRSDGSTLRDFVDPLGRPGRTQFTHRVYGRGGVPCLRCGSTLLTTRIAQRMTVFCPVCQHP